MPKGTRIEAFLESIKDSVNEEATIADEYDEEEEIEESSAAVSDDSLDAIQATTTAPITGREYALELHAPLPPQQQNELIQQLKKRLKKTVSENATSFVNNSSTIINDKLCAQKAILSGALSQQSLNLKRPEPKPRSGTFASAASNLTVDEQKTAHIRQLTATTTNWQIKG